ncbi:hypothetical protein ACFLU6_04255 [Acidobacteriota bacterium]
MNPVHLHLILNHGPVVGVPLCLLLLAAALLMRTREVSVAAFGLCVIVTALGFAAFLTGEPAEIAMESTAEESFIEPHEEAADIAVWAVGAFGACALIGLFFALIRKRVPPRRLVWSSLVLALLASIALAWAANLGGEIRHPEIRTAPIETEAQ